MPKNLQQFHNNQPRMGIFFKGLFRPRSKPPPSVSTLAMFESFFKYNPFPIALLVDFCVKADPTPDSAPVANVGRTVFAKNGKAFAAKPARNPPYIFIL